LVRGSQCQSAIVQRPARNDRHARRHGCCRRAGDSSREDNRNDLGHEGLKKRRFRRWHGRSQNGCPPLRGRNRLWLRFGIWILTAGCRAREPLRWQLNRICLWKRHNPLPECGSRSVSSAAIIVEVVLNHLPQSPTEILDQDSMSFAAQSWIPDVSRRSLRQWCPAARRPRPPHWRRRQGPVTPVARQDGGVVPRLPLRDRSGRIPTTVCTLIVAPTSAANCTTAGRIIASGSSSGDL
jgi:hypothetical protein